MTHVSKERVHATSNLLNRLKKSETVQNREYKYMLETAYSLLASDNDVEYNLGLSIICHVAESKPKDNFVHQLLFDCIVESRVFLYHQMYQRIDVNYAENIERSTFDVFGESFYTLPTGTILTRDQKRLFEDFQKCRRLVVSAPTSFGKSRIVSEIIVQNTYNNVAIILPTIALLNETTLSFRRNQLITSRYKLINTLTQEFGETGNIFILTPEKMDLLLDMNLELKIDFFTMDEIYKIDDDDRKQVFTHCLYRLSKMNSDFYLIGPYFKEFSKNFLIKTNSIFRRYSAEIVQKDTVDITSINYHEEFSISRKKFKRLKNDDTNLLNIVSQIDGQSLVYLGKKNTVETRAKWIAEKLQNKNINNELTDYIKSTIDDEWSLVKCLEKGVAFHHSAIPKYIQTEIIDSFNKGSIDILVCTSTLTEGVNTSAKNIIISDNCKADKPLSGFDVKNIKGRAGRFLSHFIGRVIVLEPLNQEMEKELIEFSYYDNSTLSPEEIIQIDKVDLYGNNLLQRNEMEDTLDKYKIPVSLVKKNKFIPIYQQYLLINHLRTNPEQMTELILSSPLPSNKQIDLILHLCHEYLFNDKDKNDKNFTIGNLGRLTKFYVHHSPSIKELIREMNDVKAIDTKIRKVFTLISRYFEFSLPKYFSAFENIFNYVYSEKNGKSEALSLKILIMKLEFGYIEKHEIALKEAGVPVGIISKIAVGLQDCDNIDKIKAKLAFNPRLTSNLSNYEKLILDKYI